MADVLAEIAAYKREEVARRKAATTTAATATTATRGFRAALERAAEPVALIAEIKKASPSKGLIRADFDAPALARAYAQGGAACLSVLTDGPSFQGSEADLAAARAAAPLPVLRKDFLVDPWQVAESRALGADAILVILAMVDDALAGQLMAEAERLGMDALVEVHDAPRWRAQPALARGWSGSTTATCARSSLTWAVTERLARRLPPGALLVDESGIFTRPTCGGCSGRRPRGAGRREP